MKNLITATALTLSLATPVFAGNLSFDRAWKEQGFLRLSSNDYGLKGSRLDVVSDGTVSLLWRAVSQADRSATKASWRWSVTESVPGTDLRRKGGDDRNLAMYFVFTSEGVAASANPNRAVRLLRNEDTHGIVYVWGGTHNRGATFGSPYHPRMKTIVLRGSGTGSHSESVDLAADYRRAFGKAPGVLIGVGVSADSDDTDSVIRGSISNLSVR